MTLPSHDPIFNVIHDGINRAIRVTLENSCLHAAIVLIYTGIDALAYLCMPSGKNYVQGGDFIAWADKYIRFPCEEQLTGLELYNARNGMVHTYSSHSKGTDLGNSRIVGYMDRSVPEVRYKPNSDDLVMVSIEGLAEAFFKRFGKVIN